MVQPATVSAVAGCIAQIPSLQILVLAQTRRQSGLGSHEAWTRSSGGGELFDEPNQFAGASARSVRTRKHLGQSGPTFSAIFVVVLRSNVRPSTGKKLRAKMDAPADAFVISAPQDLHCGIGYFRFFSGNVFCFAMHFSQRGPTPVTRCLVCQRLTVRPSGPGKNWRSNSDAAACSWVISTRHFLHCISQS
jgi:hypothetical protein